eukprot:TRINITY_DN7852_c0_g1_i6.p2 TRINITY_DN7852_c0_g1~~TRINITY_DN7852_c0_g1_i6.p2  ORF type:complete len:153 (+),score=60.08 TRINITY_DN7852_c0_g1_i6:66-524(+)
MCIRDRYQRRVHGQSAAKPGDNVDLRVEIETREDDMKKEAGVLTKKLKKVKLDDDEELKHMIEQNVIGSIPISQENCAYVYKKIHETLNKGNRALLTYNELWTLIKEDPSRASAPGGNIESREMMVRALVELSNKDRIMLDERGSESIYLLQ